MVRAARRAGGGRRVDEGEESGQGQRVWWCGGGDAWARADIVGMKRIHQDWDDEGRYMKR